MQEFNVKRLRARAHSVFSDWLRLWTFLEHFLFKNSDLFVVLLNTTSRKVFQGLSRASLFDMCILLSYRKNLKSNQEKLFQQNHTVDVRSEYSSQHYVKIIHSNLLKPIIHGKNLSSHNSFLGRLPRMIHDYTINTMQNSYMQNY